MQKSEGENKRTSKQGGGKLTRGEVIEFNVDGAPFDKMGNICTIMVVIESLLSRRTDL